MSALIKICGLSTLATLDAALEAGADLVGFVFFPPSPRHVGFAAARTLAARVRPGVRKVAVSVDATDAHLKSCIVALKPDLLQLHGCETPERVAAVRARFRLPVMKTLPLSERSDLLQIRQYAKVADFLMFDARAPHGATRPGGFGKTFDWRLLENLDLAVPFMVSGGIEGGNVEEALRISRADGLDVSSGVENAPGEKDADMIRAFVQAARAADVKLARPPRSNAAGAIGRR